MNIPNSFLTVTVDNPAELTADGATTDATDSVDATVTAGTTEANTAETTEATTGETADEATQDGSEANVSVDGGEATATDGAGEIAIDPEVVAQTQEAYNSAMEQGYTEVTVDENGSVLLSNPDTQETMTLEEAGIDVTALESALSDVSQAQVPVQKEMTGLIGGIYVVYAIFCVALIALILSQKKRSAAFGNGMSSGAQTYWDKNKGRSMEGKIDLYTKWGIGIFIAFTFIITLL